MKDMVGIDWIAGIAEYHKTRMSPWSWEENDKSLCRQAHICVLIFPRNQEHLLYGFRDKCHTLFIGICVLIFLCIWENFPYGFRDNCCILLFFVLWEYSRFDLWSYKERLLGYMNTVYCMQTVCILYIEDCIFCHLKFYNSIHHLFIRLRIYVSWNVSCCWDRRKI